MARPPKPRYEDGAWRTDFGGIRRRILIKGPKNDATSLQAEKELLRLREEARLFDNHGNMDTLFGVVVEEFLDDYVGRPAYADFFNELHWFMGGSSSKSGKPKTKRGQDRPVGGRFGFPCKAWPIRRINADVVEKYLRQRKKAGLSGYHAFVAIRTLLNWAKKKGYLPAHDLDRVDRALRRKGRRRYLPPDADVVCVFRARTVNLRSFFWRTCSPASARVNSGRSQSTNSTPTTLNGSCVATRWSSGRGCRRSLHFPPISWWRFAAPTLETDHAMRFCF